MHGGEGVKLELAGFSSTHEISVTMYTLPRSTHTFSLFHGAREV